MRTLCEGAVRRLDRVTVSTGTGLERDGVFAERGYRAARSWLSATREAISSCACSDGCPSCVQSPKCGNRNSPLDKAGALTVLRFLMDHADHLVPADASTDGSGGGASGGSSGGATDAAPGA